MTEKLKETLAKQISLFNDYKKNTKYLVYFSSSSSNAFKIQCTNGVDVWTRTLSDDKFLTDLIQREKLSTAFKLDDLLSCIHLALRDTKFEVNAVINGECGDDLVEFKVDHVDHHGKKLTFKFTFDSAKSNANELKSLLFGMHERMTKSEEELMRRTNKTMDHASAESSSTAKNGDASESEHGLRRFRMNSSQSAVAAVNRKAGMSIINPNSKRRKMPKGVKFDDDEANSDEGEGETDENSSSSSPRKLVRNHSSQSDN